MSNRDYDWLSLVEVSGPFLAVPVLKEVFPQGLDALPTGVPQRLRSAYNEWRDAVDADDPDLDHIHSAWVEEVLRTALEADDGTIRWEDGASSLGTETDGLPGVGLALVDPTRNDEMLLPIRLLPPDGALDQTGRRGASSSPAERMAGHLRSLGQPLGMVTNGERWMIVHAPVGGVATYASWYARIWGQELDTLRAFVSLLGVRRFFGPEEGRLPHLLVRSLDHQDEVTDALGEQVRRAVEVLVQALDRADQDRDRELLRSVSARELYEAGLTVMMRLVFLLAAEERGLLLLGEPRYDAFYALSTLRVRLRAQTDELLERRRSAWSRLLALFRAVYGGIDHPTLHLPAMGGSLFDPDRFPFLEGRSQGTSWKEIKAEPLPIDDRTVLLLLDAIQLFQGRTLSYRGLDVEQIGHVYEGLLERTVVRVDDVTLEIRAGKQAKDPRITLGELESAGLDGVDAVIDLLVERSRRSTASLRKDLGREVDDRVAVRLLAVCQGDEGLRDRILPYAALLRTDPWGYPLVHPKGAFVVVFGADRRTTGTHYTPKLLTERIVQETLTPLVYEGPADGEPRDEWRLRDSKSILGLAVCDPAMGSGAFLVQACRWLSSRLLETWEIEERENGIVVGLDGLPIRADSGAEAIPVDPEERGIHARRLVAERCLYGVDVNPMAVELAKLSIWLVTMAKGRPFGFLDHNLRAGDSLLGLHDLDQLACLTMAPGKGTPPRLFAPGIRKTVDEAQRLRTELRAFPIRDIRDIEAMAHLDEQAKHLLAAPSVVADAIVGSALAINASKKLDDRLAALAPDVSTCLSGDEEAEKRLLMTARRDLDTDLPRGAPARCPFHWPLEFPEVFQGESGGFDAFVGNPPFLGGQKLTGALGTAFRNHLVRWLAGGTRGSADLVAYFFLRVLDLLRPNGHFGLLAVNTIAEGASRQVGLERMVGKLGATIHAAYPNEPWPGKAAVVTSRVHVRKGGWGGDAILSGHPAPYISPFLSDEDEWSPKRLAANAGQSFQGCIVLGMGFVVSESEAMAMIESDQKNRDVLFPYLNGKDLNGHPEQKPSRWVINFWDWPEEKARTYEEPFSIVEEKVRPERQRRKVNGDYKLRKPLPQRWWQYGEKRPALYHTIGRGHSFDKHPNWWDRDTEPMKHVLVIPETTKYCLFTFYSNDVVFSHMTKVVAIEDVAVLMILNSSIHEAWARKYSSTLETRLKYITSDAFETFPFPKNGNQSELSRLGREYHISRSRVMRDNWIGPTKLYNRFHDPDEDSSQINELRDLHCQIDESVVKAYGWENLDLEHGFHKVDYLPANDRVRFTFSESVRKEVLRHLARLNRDHYEEEVRQGFHEKKRATKSRRHKPVAAQGVLLPFPDNHPFMYPRIEPEVLVTAEAVSEYNDGRVGDDKAILEFLDANPGWHAKSEILSATGVQEEVWTSVIRRLMSNRQVEQRGERRRAKYRAAPNSALNDAGSVYESQEE